MAEVTVRRQGELIRKAFDILLQHSDGLPAKEVLEQIEKSVALSDFEKSTYPNRPDVRRFEKIVRFASIPHVKAGWLLKSRGRWTVTKEGEEAYRRFPDPEQFRREAVRLYRQWAVSRSEPPEDGEDEEAETPGATITFETAEEMAWAEIRQHLEHMNPYEFQKLVAALLHAMHYHVSWIAPPGPYRGIDIIAFTDPLGTSVPRIKVQVKRQESKVNVAGLRAFLAVLGDQDVGLFVCTGGFTSDAEEEARTHQSRKVTLLNMEQMFELWVGNYSGLSEEEKELLPLRPVYYLAPAD